MAAQQQRKQSDRRKTNRYDSFSDDSQDEDQEAPVSGRVNMVYGEAVLRGLNTLASKPPKLSPQSETVSAGVVDTPKVSQLESVTIKRPVTLVTSMRGTESFTPKCFTKKVTLPSAKAALSLELKPQHQAMGSTNNSAVGMNSLLDHSFGVDSMASLHITGSKSKSLVRSLTDCSPIPVRVADVGNCDRATAWNCSFASSSNKRSIDRSIDQDCYSERILPRTIYCKSTQLECIGEQARLVVPQHTSGDLPKLTWRQQADAVNKGQCVYS